MRFSEHFRWQKKKEKNLCEMKFYKRKQLKTKNGKECIAKSGYQECSFSFF